MFVRRFFLLLMLWISTSAYAMPYEQRVEAILDKSHWIQLTDGSLWQVKTDSQDAQSWQNSKRSS